MDLGQLAQQLCRNKNYELTVALRELVGQDELLRWFACDCAERAIRREGRFQQVDRRSVRALSMGRKLTIGEVTSEGLAAIRYAASDAARSSSSDGASDAAKSILDPSPLAAALGASEAAARAAAKDHSIAYELYWQRQRLAYLCEVWQICGHRALWMMHEQVCPIEAPPQAEIGVIFQRS